MRNLSLILIGILAVLVLASGCIEETTKNRDVQPFQSSKILIEVEGNDTIKSKIKNAVLNNINPSYGLTYDNINISANRKPGRNEEYEVKVTCISSNAPFMDKYLFLYLPLNDEIILKSYVLMAISERDRIKMINIALNDEEIKQKLRNYKIYSEPTVKRILPEDSEKYSEVRKTLFSVTWMTQDRRVIVISALVDIENNKVVKRWYSDESDHRNRVNIRQIT